MTYAGIVTRLIQKNALFYKHEEETSGAIFHLPEDTEYGSTAITGTNAVPDYPTGYTIPLYAVYRERSLVFIEYAVDASGTPSRTVLASYPYNDYVDYPAQYQNSDSYLALTASGYKLLKWGVNSFDIGATAYPSNAAAYHANKESYKNTATSMGTFDINVYTIYAAQVTDTTQKLLTATGDPTAINVSTYTYKLPMSMQNGVIKYQLLANDGSAYNGQWTARFEIQGTVIAGSKYQFSFANAIPKGTKLTLCDRSDGTLEWYYYIAREAVSAISSDEFTLMGSGNVPAVLPGGNEGDVLMENLQLTADFSAVDSPANDNVVTVKLVIADQEPLVIPGLSLSYTTVAAATASIAASAGSQNTAGTFMVTVTPGSDNRLDGKKLYAVAEIYDSVTDEAISVPYEATATCGGIPGIWIGGYTVAFELSDYAQMDHVSYDWTISGLPAGDYSVIWYLTAAAGGTRNPFDRILAKADPVQISQGAIPAPYMTAVLTQIDGAVPAGQVLTTGSAHAVTFAVETNQSIVEYFVEKQTVLRSFSTIMGTVSTVDGSIATVLIPEEAGVYRVRFSIKTGSEWDDVYCTFIVR